MRSIPSFWIAALFILSLSYSMIPAEAVTDNTKASTTPEAAPKTGQTGLASAFIASFSTIVVSELGDKTFFIAAIMAMRYNRIAVLAGALLALFLMTAISTGFGTLVTSLVPPFYTHVITTLLFFFFGVKLLYDAYNDEGGETNNEKSEVELELNELHTKMMEKKSSTKNPNLDGSLRKQSIEDSNNADSENGKMNHHNVDIEAAPKNCVNQFEQVASKLVFWQALTLTFLGEWGDRSQISTIALAANSNAFMVFIGAFLGHCICTSLAVAGGKYLANKISERSVNIAGGILFLIFGIHNVFFA